MSHDVVSVRPETPVNDLVGVLLGRDSRAVPVVD